MVVEINWIMRVYSAMAIPGWERVTSCNIKHFGGGADGGIADGL